MMKGMREGGGFLGQPVLLQDGDVHYENVQTGVQRTFSACRPNSLRASPPPSYLHESDAHLHKILWMRCAT